MRKPLIMFLLLAMVVGSSCAPYVRQVVPASYTAKVLYSKETLVGPASGAQSVLVLPVLAKNGLDTSMQIPLYHQVVLLSYIRRDIQFLFREAFEKKYLESYDSASLNGFFRSLGTSRIVAVQTSDSVWKSMNASYLLAVRLKYAATIRSFDGNNRRRLAIETELWDVTNQEAVWRLEVTGLDKNFLTDDSQFVEGALKEAFDRLSRFVPATVDNEW